MSAVSFCCFYFTYFNPILLTVVVLKLFNFNTVQCSANKQQFFVNSRVNEAQSSSLVSQGSDYVLVFLPCSRNTIQQSMQNAFAQIASNPENRYHIVKVNQNGQASVYQNEKGQTYNFDVKEALNSVGEDNNSSEPVNKESLYHGLFLAANLFSSRVAQQRKLIIVSCGNCVDYSPLKSIRLSKLLNQRNIVVSSYSTSYSIVDQDSNEELVGYGRGQVFLLDSETPELELSDLDSYLPEHKGDLCHRLAQKTNGYVFNLNKLNEEGVFAKVIQKQLELKPNYQHTLRQCVRLDTPFGDFDDFQYEQTAEEVADE